MKGKVLTAVISAIGFVSLAVAIIGIALFYTSGINTAIGPFYAVGILGMVSAAGGFVFQKKIGDELENKHIIVLLISAIAVLAGGVIVFIFTVSLGTGVSCDNAGVWIGAMFTSLISACAAVMSGIISIRYLIQSRY